MADDDAGRVSPVPRVAVAILAAVVGGFVLLVLLPSGDGRDATGESGGSAPEEPAQDEPGQDEPGQDEPRDDADDAGSRDADGAPAPPVDDLAGVGANAEAMLRPEIPRLVVEVAVQEGVAADPQALDHLVAILEREADKPGGVEVVRTSFDDDRERWSPQDLRQVADEHRTRWSDEQAATVLVLYVRGAFEDEDAIGVAYNASEAALFPERWEGLLEGLLATDADVERAALTHEVGHLLGLVELVYDSAHDREHPDAPGHSRSEDSVMHPAVETTAVGRVFDGPPPDDFDAADRDDLEQLRTGGS